MKRKLFISSAVALVLGSTVSVASAADSATLSVTGKIIPTTCDIALSNTSLSVGRIPANTLIDKANPINNDNTELSVNCSAASLVSIQTTDNRTASAMTATELSSLAGGEVPNLTDADIFGIGLDSAGNKVGALMIAVTGVTADSAKKTNLLVSSDKASWTATSLKEANRYTMPLTKNGYFALASDSSSVSPVTFTNATFSIGSGVLLKKADQYPSGEEVDIDGNVTFSLVYL